MRYWDDGFTTNTNHHQPTSLKICNVLSAAELIEGCAGMMVKVGVRRMHHTCPDLTLTIAAMERMLYFYILVSECPIRPKLTPRLIPSQG